MRHSPVDLTAKHYTHYSLEDRRTVLNKLPHYNELLHNTAKRTGTDTTVNTDCNNFKISTQKTDQKLPNSAYRHTYTPSKSEHSTPENADSTINSKSLYTNTKALYILDIQGKKNWHSQGDSNPCLQTENLPPESHNHNTTNTLPESTINELTNSCPKPFEQPDSTCINEDKSLAEAILAIDKLPIDSSTKIQLIKELATKLTETSNPEPQEGSPNA